MPATATPRAITNAGTLRKATLWTSPSLMRTVAVTRRGHATRMHGPCAERDRAVAARRRVSVLVPEQHAQIGTVVVGRHEKAAVHVRVSPRLVTQHPPNAIDLIRSQR